MGDKVSYERRLGVDWLLGVLCGSESCGGIILVCVNLHAWSFCSVFGDISYCLLVAQKAKCGFFGPNGSCVDGFKRHDFC